MTSTPDLKCLIAVLALVMAAAPTQAVPGNDELRLARQALDQGDGFGAEVHARRALKSGVSRAGVAALMGEAELQQDNLAEARKWLEQRDFPAGSAARGFYALGRLELRQGHFPAAADAFDHALALGPDNAALWVDIGTLRYRTGEHVIALEAAERAVQLDPRLPAALLFRGMLLRDAEGSTAALAWFQKALAIAPEDLDLMGQYAATLGEIGRNREMLKIARNMVEIDPRHPKAYYLQAVLAARTGQTELARRLLQRCDGAYDDTPSGMLLSGVLEFRSGNIGAAVDRFDALARRQPDNAIAPLMLGRALLASGEVNELVARLAPLADREDASPYLLALVGRAYERLGKREKAAGYLDHAAISPPPELFVLPANTSGMGPIRYRMGNAERMDVAIPLVRELLSSGRGGEALELVARLRIRFPGSADVALLAGDAALFAGRPAQALEHYALVAGIRRSRPLVLRMAAALNDMDRGEDAALLLAEFQAQRPMDRELAAGIAGPLHFARR